MAFYPIDDAIKTDSEAKLNCESVEVTFDCTKCLKSFKSQNALEEHECNQTTAVKTCKICHKTYVAKFSLLVIDFIDWCSPFKPVNWKAFERSKFIAKHSVNVLVDCVQRFFVNPMLSRDTGNSNANKQHQISQTIWETLQHSSTVLTSKNRAQDETII